MPRLGFACMYRHPLRSLSAKALEAIERPVQNARQF